MTHSKKEIALAPVISRHPVPAGNAEAGLAMLQEDAERRIDKAETDSTVLGDVLGTALRIAMPYLTSDEVESIARRAHAAQVDKAGRPYVEHLAAVANGVAERGGSSEQIAAAWLHDAVEDDALSEDWLAGAALSPMTKDIVLALTKRPGETLEDYTARVLATPGALLVKEADVANNADPARLAVLDPVTRDRLTAKYARMRRLLGLIAPAN